jgi:hypothetical protein
LIGWRISQDHRNDDRRRIDAAATAFSTADERKLNDWRAETNLWVVAVHEDSQALLAHLDRLACES